MKFDELIKKVYYDPGGYGSIQDTFKEVKKLNSSVKLDDIKDWFERTIERKKNLRGFNSYISKGPLDEFEVDLFDVNYLGQKEYPHGLLSIDNFTKVMWVIPIPSKSGVDILAGMKQIINNMGKPKKIYSDEEPGMVKSNEFKNWLDENNILHITTRGHANTAERAIRTFKDLMTRRLEGPGNEGVRWYDQVRLAILMKYNQKMVNRTTGLTPYDAREKKNEAHVRTMLEINAIRKRKYPDLKVGDRVKIYKKKDKLDKERIGVWSQLTYEVEEIKQEKGQEFYYLSGHDRPMLRHEILKVRT